MSVLAFGGVTSGIYKLLLLLHIVSVVAAFAPAFAHPLLARQSQTMAAGPRQQLLGYVAANSKKVYAPALIAVGAFGLLLVIASDEAWEFSQTWVSLSFLGWIAINGVVHAMIVPGERTAAAGDAAGEKKAELGGQIASVLFLVMLYLMIWKPGA